jgi:hypothetical protein
VPCYIEGVKRLLAILLLLALGLPGVEPLFALSLGDVENKLPACCRRNGVHHCNSPVSFHSGSETTLSSPPTHCRSFPGVVPPGQKSSYALTSISSFKTPLVAASTVKPSVPGAWNKSLSFSRLTRGPPVVSLL